jgi:hypothetical protein
VLPVVDPGVELLVVVGLELLVLEDELASLSVPT